jgi:hypothetical protein
MMRGCDTVSGDGRQETGDRKQETEYGETEYGKTEYRKTEYGGAEYQATEYGKTEFAHYDSEVASVLI